MVNIYIGYKTFKVKQIEQLVNKMCDIYEFYSGEYILGKWKYILWPFCIPWNVLVGDQYKLSKTITNSKLIKN